MKSFDFDVGQIHGCQACSVDNIKTHKSAMLWVRGIHVLGCATRRARNFLLTKLDVINYEQHLTEKRG